MTIKKIYNDCLTKIRSLTYSNKLNELFMEFEHIDNEVFKFISKSHPSEYKKIMTSYCYWFNIHLHSHEIDEILIIIQPFLNLLK